ncbi:hypothetical protein AVEN_147545-1 [Araneus ventricosus]|uniref:Uncharacterized protein n=1 Tax=Araneus ventricosus TaxID=182803 RepID=A0A4Y2SUG7_ARAVE|nr:hypothetical protein AVEN_147545-1 [Araneus ventricosus]
MFQAKAVGYVTTMRKFTRIPYVVEGNDNGAFKSTCLNLYCIEEFTVQIEFSCSIEEIMHLDEHNVSRELLFNELIQKPVMSHLVKCSFDNSEDTS